MKTLLKTVNVSGDATNIDYNQFLTLMGNKMLARDSKEEMLKAFKLFDQEGKGKIGFNNLKRVARELGESLTDQELQEMYVHVALLIMSD